MLLKDQLDILIRMDFYIGHHATGTPQKFASKMGMSKRMLYHYLKFLKEEFDAPINYSRKESTYRYESPVKLDFGYKKLQDYS